MSSCKQKKQIWKKQNWSNFLYVFSAEENQANLEILIM